MRGESGILDLDYQVRIQPSSKGSDNDGGADYIDFVAPLKITATYYIP